VTLVPSRDRFAPELLELLEELPPQPSSGQRIAEALDDPRTDAVKLARLLAMDSAIAARVAKLANSAHYAVPGGVTSLERAVAVIGFSSIYQLVIYVQTQQLLSKSGRPPPPQLQAHSRAVTTLALALAKEARLRVDGLYAGALLHDLGHLALHAVAPALFQRLSQRLLAGAALLEAENELLGLDHPSIGLWLGTRWRFPPALLSAIGDHHGALPAAGQPMGIAALVGAADRWAFALGHSGLEPQQPTPTIAELGLPPDPTGAIGARMKAALASPVES